MDCSTSGFPVLHHLPECAQTHVHWIDDAIQPSHPFFLLPLIFLSIRVFSSELVLHIRWPNYWSFSFSISPSNEYSGLISFRIAWFNLLAVQWTLRSLLQHHSLKSSVLWHSAFFVVQLSHPYMTTRKTIALTIQTFVGKVMSLLFKFPMKVYRSFSSKEQASLNFLAAVTVCSDFGAQENKVCHCFHFHFFPIYLPWSDGTRCHDLKFFECWVLSQLFHSSLSFSSRGSLVPLHFQP